MPDELVVYESANFQIRKNLGDQGPWFPPNHYPAEIKYDVHNCSASNPNIRGAIFS
jgi:hypothetical protein